MDMLQGHIRTSDIGSNQDGHAFFAECVDDFVPVVLQHVPVQKADAEVFRSQIARQLVTVLLLGHKDQHLAN